MFCYCRAFAATIPREQVLRYNPYTQSVEVLDNKNTLTKLVSGIQADADLVQNALQKIMWLVSLFVDDVVITHIRWWCCNNSQVKYIFLSVCLQHCKHLNCYILLYNNLFIYIVMPSHHNIIHGYFFYRDLLWLLSHYKSHGGYQLKVTVSGVIITSLSWHTILTNRFNVCNNIIYKCAQIFTITATIVYVNNKIFF